MVEHPAQLIMLTNDTSFHGFPAGTLLLNRGGSKGRRHILKFEHRPSGFDEHIESQVFQFYGSVNFKYALRALHRQGFRDVRLIIVEPV